MNKWNRDFMGLYIIISSWITICTIDKLQYVHAYYDIGYIPQNNMIFLISLSGHKKANRITFYYININIYYIT